MNFIKNFNYFFIMLFLFNTVIDSVNQQKEEKHFKYYIKVRVSSIEITRKKIMDFINNSNGYIQSIDNQYLEIVYPNNNDKIKELIEEIKKRSSVLEEKTSSEDFSEKLLTLETQIKVKNKYYDDLKKMISESNFTQTLEMEKEIYEVVSELEGMKGEYNYLLFLTQNVNIKIHLVSQGQSHLPSPDIPLWVNSLGIFYFLERFHEN